MAECLTSRHIESINDFTLADLKAMFERVQRVYNRIYYRSPYRAERKFAEWVDKFWTNYSGGYYNE